MSGGEIEQFFSVTPVMLSVMQEVTSFAHPTFDNEAARHFLPWTATANEPLPSLSQITLSDLQQLSQLCRGMRVVQRSQQQAAELEQRGKSWCEGFLHELLAGSSLCARPVSTVSSEHQAFQRRLARLRVLHEQQEFKQLVNKVQSHTEQQGSFVDGGSAQQVSFGLNIISLMATGFFVFWCFGRSLAPAGNTVVPICAGLVGLVGAMLVETSLFVLREEKTFLKARAQKQLEEANFSADLSPLSPPSLVASPALAARIKSE